MAAAKRPSDVKSRRQYNTAAERRDEE